MEDKKRLIVLAVSICVVLILTIVGYYLITNNEMDTDVTSSQDIGPSNQVVKQTKDISVNIYGKDDDGIIYTRQMETENKYLVDVLKDMQEINAVLEDGQYGAYITSIMDIEQGDGYYWMYYVNNEYATEGISSCIVEDNAVYDFKIEKFEN